MTSFSIPIICVLMGLARDRNQLPLSLSIFSILVESSYFISFKKTVEAKFNETIFG
jgi:hypothetical protein